MSWIGDIRLGDTFDTKFTTRQISGAPATLASSPVISAYVGNSTTQLTAGITLSVDFDSVTGLNNIRVVATSGNGYATASNYQLVITTGTVNSVSVVGEVVAEVSIEARSAVMPTTAARTLAVDASGRALSDVDTIKTNPVVNGGTITFPTTATLASTTNITAGTVTTASNVTTVNGLAAGVITAAAIADGAIDRATFAADTGLQTIRSNTAQAGAAGTITLDASASAVDSFYIGAWIYITGATGIGQARLCTAYVGATKVATVVPNWATNPDVTSTFAVIAAADLRSVSGAVGSVAGNVGGNVVGTVASVVGAVGSVAGNVVGSVGSMAAGGIANTSFAAGAIDAAAIAASAIGASEIAADAITAAKIADGAIDAATFAAGAIDATAIATNAIDADALAADAVTEIWAKAIAELAQATPSATPSVLNAIAALYMMARNTVNVTATEKQFTNDAGTVVFKKALSDDGVTYSETEMVAGP